MPRNAYVAKPAQEPAHGPVIKGSGMIVAAPGGGKSDVFVYLTQRALPAIGEGFEARAMRSLAQHDDDLTPVRFNRWTLGAPVWRTVGTSLGTASDVIRDLLRIGGTLDASEEQVVPRRRYDTVSSASLLSVAVSTGVAEAAPLITAFEDD